MTKRRPTVFASLSAGRRTERLVLLAATTLFIGGLVCGFYRFNQNLATEYGDVSDASAYAAVHLEYALETRRQSVEMLAEQAAELMSGRYSLNLQPTLRLDPRPDQVIAGIKKHGVGKHITLRLGDDRQIVLPDSPIYLIYQRLLIHKRGRMKSRR